MPKDKNGEKIPFELRILSKSEAEKLPANYKYFVVQTADGERGILFVKKETDER